MLAWWSAHSATPALSGRAENRSKTSEIWTAPGSNWKRVGNRNVQNSEEHDDEDRRDELGHRLLRRAEEEEELLLGERRHLPRPREHHGRARGVAEDLHLKKFGWPRRPPKDFPQHFCRIVHLKKVHF